MYTDETKLKDIILERSLPDVFRLVENSGLHFPFETTDGDMDLLRDVFEKRGMDRNLYEYYLDFEKPELYRRSDESDEEFRERSEAFGPYYEAEERKAELVRLMKRRRKSIASSFARQLLKPEKMLALFSDMNADPVNLMKEMYEGRLERDEDGFFVTEFAGNERWNAKALENLGYGSLRRIMPVEAKDAREHITGVFVPTDVLKVFMEINTAEAERERHTRSWVNEICYVLLRYHDISSVDNVMELYKKAAGKDSFCRDLNDTELVKEAESCAGIWNIFKIRPAGNTFYVCEKEGWIDDYLEDEQMSFEELVKNYKSSEQYLPSLEEVEEFQRYGFWPSKKPYAELLSFMRDFYLDEMQIENAGRRMFYSMIGEKNMYMYSIDDVEENAFQKSADAAMILMNGSSAEDAYDTMEEITAPITEKARVKFRNILEECEKVTPKPELNGYTMLQKQG